MKLTCKSIDYHRNGVSGLGFHVLIANDGETDKLIVRFPEEADKDTGNVVCAVFDLARIQEGNIAFLENSFRGDYYAEEADRIIKETPLEQHQCALNQAARKFASKKKVSA